MHKNPRELHKLLELLKKKILFFCLANPSYLVPAEADKGCQVVSSLGHSKRRAFSPVAEMGMGARGMHLSCSSRSGSLRVASPWLSKRALTQVNKLRADKFIFPDTRVTGKRGI